DVGRRRLARDQLAEHVHHLGRPRSKRAEQVRRQPVSSSVNVVISSRMSGIGDTPMPGPDGTRKVPSSSTNGSVTSRAKYRFDADVSPGSVKFDMAAMATLAARPMRDSSI